MGPCGSREIVFRVIPDRPDRALERASPAQRKIGSLQPDRLGSDSRGDVVVHRPVRDEQIVRARIEERSRQTRQSGCARSPVARGGVAGRQDHPVG